MDCNQSKFRSIIVMIGLMIGFWNRPVCAALRLLKNLVLNSIGIVQDALRNVKVYYISLYNLSLLLKLFQER